jgi:hypothetical protein
MNPLYMPRRCGMMVWPIEKIATCLFVPRIKKKDQTTTFFHQQPSPPSLFFFSDQT